ncbi:MAG: hypothetical protein WBK55_08980 [Alphaproteobacteria bacterium]
MSVLLTPKFKSANAPLPGDLDFWRMMLDQSDNFSYQTANNNKGGPFGAQLWLVREGNKPTEYILSGDGDRLEDSNAVVSKGIASAHAEAENLSPMQRLQVMRFLARNKGQGWQVVQVSSGESCQSCRTKQVLFAEELIQNGLIERGGFHVVYKATFQQTKRDANFSDAEYDMTFRAISELGILDQKDGLLGLEATFKRSPVTSRLLDAGELIYVPVHETWWEDVPNVVRDCMKLAEPVAVIIAPDGNVLAVRHDDVSNPATLNFPEDRAIMRALHTAARNQRSAGIFESWNLGGAKLYTNISEIGPSYGETLWYNLSSINIVPGKASDTINFLARELPHLSNREAFKLAAMEYNAPGSPISVRYLGAENGANAAHMLWKAKMAHEGLLMQQAERLKKFSGLEIRLLDGSLPVEKFVQSGTISTNYDGKQAEPGFSAS